MNIQIFNGDFFNEIKNIKDGSIDMVLNDPPYGTTGIKWDEVMDFDKMWKELDRVTTPNANIIMFGSQPFTSLLITSKIDWFKYELIWNKNKCGSPGLAKYRPQKVHENIMVFSKKNGNTYNPIIEEGDPFSRFNKDGYGTGKNTHGYGFGNGKKSQGFTNDGTRYPKSILHASRNFSAQQTTHPTQKPTNVLAWLIMTYSNAGDTVLDFTMGTGSSGVACKMTSRNFIGIERDADYFNIAKNRIELCEAGTINKLDFQLTTQLHKDMKTIPNKKHEEKFYTWLKRQN
jgi:site-specific DNA-methyltransferase (adenine-specific)